MASYYYSSNAIGGVDWNNDSAKLAFLYGFLVAIVVCIVFYYYFVKNGFKLNLQSGYDSMKRISAFNPVQRGTSSGFNPYPADTKELPFGYGTCASKTPLTDNNDLALENYFWRNNDEGVNPHEYHGINPFGDVKKNWEQVEGVGSQLNMTDPRLVAVKNNGTAMAKNGGYI